MSLHYLVKHLRSEIAMLKCSEMPWKTNAGELLFSAVTRGRLHLHGTSGSWAKNVYKCIQTD